MTSAPLCPCPHCGCHFDRRREDLGTVQPHSQRFSELLLSNHIPLEVECQQIESLSAAAHVRSAELEQQITRLRASLDSLLELQMKQEVAIEQYRTVVGPVRRVPEEIWQEIFEKSTVLELLPRYYATDNFDVPPSSLSLGGTPWTLTHVSSLWRQVSISHRVLWSTVIIDARDLGEPQVWPQLLMQISRARNHPLRICLDATYGRYGEVEMFNPVVALLLSTSSRWQELFMAADCGWLSLFDKVTSVFSQLSLVCFTSATNPHPQTPFHFLQLAPSITHLATTCPIHHIVQLPPHLRHWISFWPASRVHYAPEYRPISPIDMACALDMLDIMSSLQTADICFPYHSSVVPESRVITHPSLTSLTMWRNSIPALKHLKIPTLSSLRLTAETIRCDSVVGLIDRSGCSLTELSLLAKAPWPQHVDKFQVPLRKVLERVPNLSCFVIGYTDAIPCTNVWPSGEAQLQQITELCCATETDGTPSLVSKLDILDIRVTTLLPDDLSQQIQSIRPGLTLRESKCFPPLYL